MAKKIATHKYASNLTVVFDFGGVLSGGSNGFTAVRPELEFVTDAEALVERGWVEAATPHPSAILDAVDDEDEDFDADAIEAEIAAQNKAMTQARQRAQAERQTVPGFDAEVAESAYWEHRAELDEGLDPMEYWSRVAAAAGHESLSEEDLENLNDLDQRYWLTLAQGSRELLHELALENIRLGVLSNMATDFAARVRNTDWFETIDFGLFSGDLGVSKPSKQIYYILIEAMAHLNGGVERPGNIIFFDDKPENVEAAKACGIDAHLWVANGALEGRERNLTDAVEPGWVMARRVLVERGLLR